MPCPSPLRLKPAALASSDGGGRRRAIILLAYAVLVIGRTAQVMAATAPESYVDAALIDQWQRNELPAGQCPPRITSQVTVMIETRGQRLSGRIRIPGGIASNFETARGKAVVDLINVGSDKTGFAAITWRFILLRQRPGNHSRLRRSTARPSDPHCGRASRVPHSHRLLKPMTAEIGQRTRSS
jgi:hypothetical protein